MNKRLFKPGDIVVCIDPPLQGMYEDYGVDQLKFGEIYKVRNHYTGDSGYLRTNIYLQKWNEFSGSRNSGQCSFLQKRFILRSSITDKELVFMKVKYKFGVKETK